jgi:hypothetical protein
MQTSKIHFVIFTASIALLFTVGTAQATSCSGHFAACKRLYPAKIAQCTSAVNNCRATCDKKTGTSTWYGFETGNAYPADSCK